MKQQRLSMFSRKKSIVDERFDSQLNDLKREIEEQRQAIALKRQELNGNSATDRLLFDDSETMIHVNDAAVYQILEPMKNHLRLLEKKYACKKAQHPKIQREASSQVDIFFS